MKTWHQLMTNGNGLDSYDNYGGSLEHKDHYVVLSRNRDSTILENSNFDVALEMLREVSDTVYTLEFNHWAVGWIEHIFVDPSDENGIEKATEIHENLEDYGVLDEEDFSLREWDAWEETYGSFLAKDLENEIEQREIEENTRFFLNDNDEVELTEIQDELLFKIATDNASGYNYESWNETDIVDTFITIAIIYSLPTHPDLFKPHSTIIITEEVRDAMDRLLTTTI